MDEDVWKMVGSVIGILLLLAVLPVFAILSVNQIFGTGIEMTFTNCVAMFFLLLVISGSGSY